MKRLVLLAVAVMLVALAAAPAAAQSGEESEIRSVTTEALVAPDGSMTVTETLEYDFTEDRNGGFRTFEPGFGEYEIRDFRVSEDGDSRDLAPGFDEPNFGSQVRWFGSGEHSKVSGEHSYVLQYTVVGAVDVCADAAVLNWQFVGSDFPELAEGVRVDVVFPTAAEPLQAFGHGSLNGVVEPVGNEVHLRVPSNPAGQFVETRILAPPDAFSAAPTAATCRDQILAEEAAFADAANRQREQLRHELQTAFEAEVDRGLPDRCDGADDDELASACVELARLLDDAEPRVGREFTIEEADLLLGMQRARADVESALDRIDRERAEQALNVAGPIVAVLGALGAFGIWRRWGKDPEKPTDIGEYYRDLPPEPPAVVASLDDWGGVDSKSFAATIVDLAQRGWLTITPDGDEHRFTRTQKAEGEPLLEFEANVLWRLFPMGRYTVTQDELTDEAKADRSVSSAWLRSFRSQVKAEYERHEFQAKVGCLPWLLWFLLVLVVGLVGVGGLGLTAWVGGGIAAGTAGLLLVLSPLLRRRTPKGTRKLAEVNGLKRFLEDFSLVDDVPIGHLALYERYLVYAVALGVAEKLIAGLRVRFPEIANDPGFAPWYGHAYVGAAVHGRGGGIDRLSELSALDSFAGDFTSATAAAFSPPSSSGGGGGGFSGGSSGGGGGGGAGSW